MTDLVVVHDQVASGATTADIVISGLNDAKGGWLRITSTSGTEETCTQVTHCYFDTSGNSSGVESFRETTTMRGRHRDLTSSNDTYWFRDAAGAEVITGRPTLTSTTLTLTFTASVTGAIIEYCVFCGSSVSATAFGKLGSPITVGYQANLVLGGEYCSVYNGQSTTISRFYTGAGVTGVTQVGLTGAFQFNETRHSNADWMAKVPSVAQVSAITGLTSTTVTFDRHGGPVTGLVLDTGGSVSMQTFQIASTKVDTDTVAMPDAGFDDVGFMMSWAGPGLLNTDDTSRAVVGIGIAQSAGGQRAHVAFASSSEQHSEAEDGQFVKSVRAVGTRVETRGSIDAVKRDPILTINTAPGVDTDITVLYVETKAVVTARRSYAIIG